MSLRQRPEYAALAESISERFRGFVPVYVPNPGNWGDALIQAGEREFFRAFGIQVREVRFRRLRSYSMAALRVAARSYKPHLIYGGNGALAGHYAKHAERISALLSNAATGLLMPSTLGRGLVLDRTASGIELWRRDEFESRDAFPESRFCHDMAFFLDPRPVTPTKGEGWFLRTDPEARHASPPPAASHDISRDGTNFSDVDDFFRMVSAYERIVTDRLHVAIAGALLGRDVELRANNYFKNRAIFETSLAPNYPGITFVG